MGQWSHLYFTKEWRRARARFLRTHPLCAMCERFGKITAATVVDHLRPHKGDMTLFWDESNWSPICKPCHDGPKQRHDRTGVGADINGYPLNPNKHWR